MFSPDSFRTARWIRTLNLVLQAVLFLTLIGGINYLAGNHDWGRFDLTRQRKFSLSAETLSYVKSLPRPVHIVVTMSADDPNPEIRGLLDEYSYASAANPAGRITTEFIDVYQHRRRAEELGVEQTDLILLISGDKRQPVPVDQLYRYRNKERIAFQGEEKITGALLEVASPGREKICFLVGHGELRPEDPDALRGLSALRDQLKVRNFEVESIDLAVTRRIPEASLLVAVAPQSRYTPVEQELLRQYLTAKAGRLILLLAPGISAAALGIDELLFDWGVLIYDDLILDTGYENMAENGDLLIYAFQKHPITEAFIDHQMKLQFGAARTVRPDPGRSQRSGLNVVVLAATSKTAWGERDYRSGDAVQPTRGVDTMPMPGTEPPDRLGVIVASERVGVRDNLPFTVPGGKLVVIGTGDLVANGRLDNASLMIFLNAVNWAVDREGQLSIPARPIEKFQLTLSAGDFQRLRYLLLLAVPGATLVLGLLVYWTRRA